MDWFLFDNGLRHERVKIHGNRFYILLSSLYKAFLLYFSLVFYSLHNKWSFPLRISSVDVTKSAISTDGATFTKKVLNEKLHFSCSDLVDID